jgi:hypothetical protein
MGEVGLRHFQLGAQESVAILFGDDEASERAIVTQSARHRAMRACASEQVENAGRLTDPAVAVDDGQLALWIKIGLKPFDSVVRNRTQVDEVKRRSPVRVSVLRYVTITIGAIKSLVEAILGHQRRACA